MELDKFEALAAELARDQAGIPSQLEALRAPVEELRARAAAAVGAFASRARSLGAAHLAQVSVSPVEPDEKHVDCLQFSVERGRHVLLLVAIANGEGGKVRLVGPFKRGKVEGPCADYPVRGPELESALERAILALLREASAA